MSLVINNNMMAANTARNLSDSYGRMATSVQRLSTGMRINSAADDAAGLAIRETMRAEVAALRQGVRNAQDGISMIQTAEGGLAVIDEKLIRMKELAEQAATGTYTNEQRLIIHSEFAAMAAEIDRIASSTEFNGIRLLNGNTNSAGYQGQWSANGTWDANAVDNGRGGGLIASGAGHGMWTNNSGWAEANGESDDDGNIIGGIKIHFGTSNRRAEDYYFVRIADSRTESLFRDDGQARAEYVDGVLANADLDAAAVAGLLVGTPLEGEIFTEVTLTASATVGGTNTNDLNDVGEDAVLAVGTVLGAGSTITADTENQSFSIDGITYTKTSEDHEFSWRNDATGETGSVTGNSSPVSHGNLSFAENGVITVATGETVTVTGALTTGTDAAVTFAGASVLAAGTVLTVGNVTNSTLTTRSLSIRIGDDPTELPSLTSQHSAQQALEQLNTAIMRKENIRANLGSIQNRLENTITNLSIQAENLQASESRISDVDIAQEMTEYVRNQVLTQAAVAMLGQANSLPQIALRLLG